MDGIAEGGNKQLDSYDLEVNLLKTLVMSWNSEEALAGHLELLELSEQWSGAS